MDSICVVVTELIENLLDFLPITFSSGLAYDPF